MLCTTFIPSLDALGMRIQLNVYPAPQARLNRGHGKGPS